MYPGWTGNSPGTASTRFIAPNYWRDPKSGVSYQVQIQAPQPDVTSVQDIANLPVTGSGGFNLTLAQVATAIGALRLQRSDISASRIRSFHHIPVSVYAAQKNGWAAPSFARRDAIMARCASRSAAALGRPSASVSKKLDMS